MAKKKTRPDPVRHGSFPVGHSCHTTWIPAWSKIWSASFSASDRLPPETCLKLKTRTANGEGATLSFGFSAGIVVTFAVGELRAVGLATLPCCPEIDFVRNDVATKQMTTRLTFIGAPHRGAAEVSHCLLVPQCKRNTNR